MGDSCTLQEESRAVQYTVHLPVQLQCMGVLAELVAISGGEKDSILCC